jgi:hypothetical protein
MGSVKLKIVLFIDQKLHKIHQKIISISFQLVCMAQNIFVLNYCFIAHLLNFTLKIPFPGGRAPIGRHSGWTIIFSQPKVTCYLKT